MADHKSMSGIKVVYADRQSLMPNGQFMVPVCVNHQAYLQFAMSVLLCKLQSLSNGYLHSAGMPSLYLIYSIVKNLGHLHAWAVRI